MNYSIIKRIFDFLFSIISLIIFCPLLLGIAILIKLFDNGPIIFKQRRIGKKNKEFILYKFRSLPIDTNNLPSDQIEIIKLKTIGKFIRRTNIDELPQLINIMKGDMSFVGPRPALKSQVDLINLRSKNKSYLCTPGLTGLAQINAFDGMSIYQKSYFDEEYKISYNFILDIIIIIRTFFYLFKRPPKY